MKKIYVVLGALFIASSVTAQDLKPYQAPADKNIAMPMPQTQKTGFEPIAIPPVEDKIYPSTTMGTNKSATFWETIIGLTVYDLQSNGTVQNRLAQTSNLLSAGFTMSQQSANYTDRGTGYNYGLSDVNLWEDESFERLESVRVGWPSMIHTGNGREIAITHQSSGNLLMTYRDLIGTGDWIETEIESNIGQSLLWPRAVSGGPDGNSIHLICVTTPVANDGELYQGLDGALLYFRSLDQGETWDIQDSVLSPIDTTLFAGFDGDSYSIFAKDDKVAFAVFHDLNDSFVMISEDNGDTFEYTTLVDFPVDAYTVDSEIIDIDEDGLADTLYNCDGGGSIHISPDMTTHVTWGNMRYLEDNLSDGNFSYFPYTDGIEYWNDTFGPDSSQTIAVTQDLDDDGIVTLEDDVALYFLSLTSMSQMSSNEDGDLFLSYSGVAETHSSGQFYRHIFLSKSEDGGETWTDGVDATPDLDFFGFESVFASMAPVVDDYLHIIYQRDFEPGLHVRGDEDAPTDNDIIYLRVTPDLVIEEFIGVDELDFDKIELYPVPAQDMVNVYFPNQNPELMQVFDLTGKLVHSQRGDGELTVLNVGDLSSGMYVLQINIDGQVHSKNLIIE